MRPGHWSWSMALVMEHGTGHGAWSMALVMEHGAWPWYTWSMALVHRALVHLALVHLSWSPWVHPSWSPCCMHPVYTSRRPAARLPCTSPLCGLLDSHLPFTIDSLRSDIDSLLTHLLTVLMHRSIRGVTPKTVGIRRDELA